jgi:drug/metabolite transporter (DMT)-like permease
MSKNSTLSKTSDDIECDYVKIFDEKYDQDVSMPKVYKMGWLLAGFLSLLCFTASNYIAGTQSGNIYAGKIANSIALGIFAFACIVYKLKTGDKDFVETFDALFRPSRMQVNCEISLTQSLFQDETMIEFDSMTSRSNIVKAVLVSALCGLLNAIAIMSLFIAFEDARVNSYNISICSAIVSGNCIYAMIASFTVFKDKITLIQTIGVFINMGGVLTISLGQGSGGVTTTMVVGSALTASWLGLRIILSRYCTSRIDSLVFIAINFLADFMFGIVMICVSFTDLFEIEVNFGMQAIVWAGALFSAGAETYQFIGIERGVAGVVVALTNTNGILIGLLNWAFQGAVPSIIQGFAIILTFIGILVMSIGDLVIPKIMGKQAA